MSILRPNPPHGAMSKTYSYSHSARKSLPKLGVDMQMTSMESSVGITHANSEIDFNKLLKLFTHRHTSDLYTRQAAAVMKVVRVRKNGLRFSELKHTCEIMRHLISSIIHHDQKQVFGDVLANLIRLYATEFVKKSAYDDIEHKGELVDVFRVIGSALECNVASVQIAVAETIEAILSSPNQSRRILCASAVVASNLVESLVQWFSKNEEHLMIDVEVSNSIFNTFVVISQTKNCANELTKYGYFNYVRSPLSLNFTSELLRLTVETCWNLLEYDTINACEALGTESNIYILSNLLSSLLDKGVRQSDKDLRNDLLVVFQLLANRKENCAHFSRTNCLRTLLYYGTYAEENGYNSIAGQTTQTASAENFEMKHLIWSIASALVPEQFCVSQMYEYHLLPNLFKYISPDYIINDPVISRWKLSELLELQKQAILTIRSLIPYLAEEFVLLNGNATLLKFAHFVVEDMASDADKELVLNECTQLRALAVNCVVHACSHLDFTNVAHSSDIFLTLLDLFKNTDDTCNVKVQTDSISILSSFCKNNPDDQRSFRKQGGLKAIMDYLKNDINSPITRNAHFRIAILDCLWNVIENNKKNTLFCLVMDGIEILLRLLLVSPNFMKKQLLGILADIVKEKKSHHYVFEWKYDEHTALSLLLSEWIHEESRLGSIIETAEFETGYVSRSVSKVNLYENNRLNRTSSILYEDDSDDDNMNNDNDGIEIINMNNTSVLNKTSDTLQAALPELEIVSEQRDLRDSIFAVLNEIGFNSFPDKTRIQRAHLKFIEKYMCIKSCQVYQDISRELKYNNITPVERDNEFLNEKIRLGVKEIKIAEELREVFNNTAKEEANDELYEFMAQVSKRKHQNGIDPIARKKFLSLKNTRNHLLAKKARDEMLSKSLDKRETLRRTAPFDSSAWEEQDGPQDPLVLEEAAQEAKEQKELDESIEASLAMDLASQGFDSNTPSRYSSKKQLKNHSSSSSYITNNNMNNNNNNNMDNDDSYITDLLHDPVSEAVFGDGFEGMEGDEDYDMA